MKTIHYHMKWNDIIHPISRPCCIIHKSFLELKELQGNLRDNIQTNEINQKVEEIKDSVKDVLSDYNSELTEGYDDPDIEKAKINELNNQFKNGDNTDNKPDSKEKI